jgi:hypothetical protein
MRRKWFLVCCLAVAAWSLTTAAGDRSRMVALDPGSALPADLVDPEDRSSWDLSSVSLTGGEPTTPE